MSRDCPARVKYTRSYGTRSRAHGAGPMAVSPCGYVCRAPRNVSECYRAWRSISNGQELSVSLVYYGDSRLSDLDLGTDRGEHPIPFQSNGEQFPSCIYYSLTSLGPYFHAFGHPGGDARRQRASYAQHAPVPSRTSGVDDLGAG